MDYKFKQMTMKEKVCYVLDGRNDTRHPAYNLHELTDMRKAVETNFIDWHPYPAEQPTDWNRYLVSVRFDTGRKLVRENTWFEDEWKAHYYNGSIYAWAELPIPSEEDKP